MKTINCFIHFFKIENPILKMQQKTLYMILKKYNFRMEFEPQSLCWTLHEPLDSSPFAEGERAHR